MAKKKIKGIFEPFADYVQKQLHVRKTIMSNPRSVETNLSLDKWTTSDDFNLEGRSTPTSEKEKNAIYGPENFYSYTTEKQAIIRMMSGVDLKDNIDPGLLEVGLDDNGNIREANGDTRRDEKYLHSSSGLAKQYILEGGTRYFNDKGGNNGTREGFTTGKFTDDTDRGFSYGDRDIRANAGDGFGVVPMPGIVDATIRTKSDNGSLREAQVNFTCYNRRQLEVLEMLYMRPGYPLCLEWGWNPFISNDFERTNNTYSIKDDFFQQYANMNALNDKIRQYKIESGGNYDGFIGYIKNFSFKAREDGGYDCTTEIMAHGEILESLKSQRMSVSTGNKLPNEEDPEVESLDRLLYYLRAIKAVLNNDGDAWYYKHQGTFYDVLDGQYTPSGVSSAGNITTVPQKYCASFKNQCTLASEVAELQGGACELYECIFDVSCTYEGPGPCTEENYTFVQKTTLDGTPLAEGQLSSDYYTSEPAAAMSTYVAPLIRTDLITEPYEDDSTILRDQLNEAGYNDTQEYVEALNKTNDHYKKGYDDIIQLYSTIVKTNHIMGAEDHNPLMGQGYVSLLGGTILKQVVKYNPMFEGDNKIDTGYRKNIYLRWDMLAQMINHLSTHKRFATKSLRYPIAEITYLHSNEDSFTNTDIVDGKIQKGQTINVNLEGKGKTYDGSYSYIKYKPAIMKSTDPEVPQYDDKLELDDISQTQKNLNKIFNSEKGPLVHPLLGNSYDEGVCLFPHMKIFHPLYESAEILETSVSTQTQVDPYFSDSLIDQEQTTDSLEVWVGQGDDRTLGVGGEFRYLTSYVMNEDSFNTEDIQLWEEQISQIGLIHFNLDFILNIYEGLRLKKKITENSTLTLLNNKFNMLDFINGLWDGANAASANYYKFTVTTEHERPHVARVIDMRFSRNHDDGIFTFEPQGLKSVTRQFFFNSKISNDMASMISIAAQAPNNIQSLESLSFKAFHKNIKSRFMTQEMSEAEATADETIAANQLRLDIDEYQKLCVSLSWYLYKLNQGNFETTEEDKVLLLNPSEAAQTAQSIMDLRYSILNRYPLQDENGNPNDGKSYDSNGDGTEDSTRPAAGFWRKGTTHENSAIIPLQFNLEMDGLAGMIPLQVFKVDKDKLPFGYQRKDIVFIIKSEEHKITSGQDWTVQIGGQMALLNLNPNNKGNQGGKHQYQNIPEELTSVNDMELSYEGELFITDFEGFRSVSYTDGFDNNGNPKYSVGYGSQMWNGQKVTGPGPEQYPAPSEVTKATARVEMVKHINESVIPQIKNHVSVDLSQQQFDAVVSYTYNVGGGNSVAGDTQFITKLNNGMYLDASKEMDIISYSQGNGTWKVLEGLMSRRAKEQRLFNGHVKGYTSNDEGWNKCEGCPRGRNETQNNAYEFTGGASNTVFPNIKYY